MVLAQRQKYRSITSITWILGKFIADNSVQVLMWMCAFISLGCIPKSATAVSYTVFTILRNCETIYTKATELFFIPISK